MQGFVEPIVSMKKSRSIEIPLKVTIRRAIGALLSPKQRKKLVWGREFLASWSVALGSEVGREGLQQLLWNQLGRRMPSSPTLYFGDYTYYLPAQEEVDAIWADSGLRDMQRDVINRFDCDDYAWAFKGHCSRWGYYRPDWGERGICVAYVSGAFGWSGSNHAAILFVNDQGEVRLFEPKNGTTHFLDECGSINALLL
jgi:hypothetical protein